MVAPLLLHEAAEEDPFAEAVALDDRAGNERIAPLADQVRAGVAEEAVAVGVHLEHAGGRDQLIGDLEVRPLILALVVALTTASAAASTAASAAAIAAAAVLVVLIVPTAVASAGSFLARHRHTGFGRFA